MNIHDAAYIVHGILNPQAAEDTREQQEEEEAWRWRQQQECEERERYEAEEISRLQKISIVMTQDNDACKPENEESRNVEPSA